MDQLRPKTRVARTRQVSFTLLMIVSFFAMVICSIEPDWDTRTSVEVKRSKTRADCNLPLETGPCRAAFQRYGYSKDAHSCVQFTYGGCLENANNFYTMEDCQRVCKRKPKQKSKILAYILELIRKIST